jgi:hypothetical protein
LSAGATFRNKLIVLSRVDRMLVAAHGKLSSMHFPNGPACCPTSTLFTGLATDLRDFHPCLTFDSRANEEKKFLKETEKNQFFEYLMFDQFLGLKLTLIY